MYREKILQTIKSPAFTDIWVWSKESHWSIFWICILNLIVSGSSLVITIATKGLIDGATAHVGSQIWFYAIVLIVTVLMIRIATLLSGLLSVRTGAVLLKDIRSMLLHKLLRKQYASLNGYHSGELVNRMFSRCQCGQKRDTGYRARTGKYGGQFCGCGSYSDFDGLETCSRSDCRGNAWPVSPRCVPASYENKA